MKPAIILIRALPGFTRALPGIACALAAFTFVGCSKGTEPGAAEATRKVVIRNEDTLSLYFIIRNFDDIDANGDRRVVFQDSVPAKSSSDTLLFRDDVFYSLNFTWQTKVFVPGLPSPQTAPQSLGIWRQYKGSRESAILLVFKDEDVEESVETIQVDR